MIKEETSFELTGTQSVNFESLRLVQYEMLKHL